MCECAHGHGHVYRRCFVTLFGANKYLGRDIFWSYLCVSTDHAISCHQLLLRFFQWCYFGLFRWIGCLHVKATGRAAIVLLSHTTLTSLKYYFGDIFVAESKFLGVLCLNVDFFLVNEASGYVLHRHIICNIKVVSYVFFLHDSAFRKKTYCISYLVYTRYFFMLFTIRITLFVWGCKSRIFFQVRVGSLSWCIILKNWEETDSGTKNNVKT